MKGKDAETRTNIIMSLALTGLIIYLGAQLIHGEMRSRAQASAEFPEPPPADAAPAQMSAGNGDAHASASENNPPSAVKPL